MIPLNRDLSNVPDNFYGSKRQQRNFRLLKEKRDGWLEAKGEKKWDSLYWKKSKEQLFKETFNKCAYCESPTTVVVYGDVEHFRPKSKYWWLAYSYENYLASCSICNQKYKKDFFETDGHGHPMEEPAIIDGMTDDQLEELAAFITVDPVDDNAGMKRDNFISQHKAEKALILNPYYDDPAEFLAYLPIVATKEVLVTPLKPEFQPIVTACEKLYGVNRKELSTHRYQYYLMYITFRHYLEKSTDSHGTNALRNRIDEMVKGDQMYTGMIRYFETRTFADLPSDFNIIVAPKSEV